MKIQTIENRMPELIGVLTQVWEASVRATHHFLMPGDVERIKEYVPQAIGGIGKLAVAFNEQDRPMVFLLWGRPAQNKKSMLTNPKHLILEAPHPSPLSAFRGFFGCRHFSKTNEYLKANGLEPIDWQIENI